MNTTVIFLDPQENRAQQIENPKKPNGVFSSCFHGRFFRAIKNRLPTSTTGISEIFARLKNFLVMSENKSKINPHQLTSFSILSYDVTRCIAAKLPAGDQNSFRQVEKFAYRCTTNQILTEENAVFENFTSFLCEQLRNKLSKEEEVSLKLPPELRKSIFSSDLKTYSELKTYTENFYRVKYAIIGVLMKHFTLESLTNFQALCEDQNLKIPCYYKKNSEQKKDVILRALDYMEPRNLNNPMMSKNWQLVREWDNKQKYESGEEYFFEFDLLLSKIDFSLRIGIHVIGDLYRGLFKHAKVFPEHIDRIVEKMNKFLNKLYVLDQDTFINCVTGYLYKSTDKAILDVFCKNFKDLLKKMPYYDGKRACERRLEVFFAKLDTI